MNGELLQVKELYNYTIEERCVILAEYLVHHRATVRSVAAHFGISKSTVHKDITQILKCVDWDLYQRAKAILEINKQERHLRGGEATRKKYINQSINFNEHL